MRLFFFAPLFITGRAYGQPAAEYFDMEAEDAEGIVSPESDGAAASDIDSRGNIRSLIADSDDGRDGADTPVPHGGLDTPPPSPLPEKSFPELPAPPPWHRLSQKTHFSSAQCRFMPQRTMVPRRLRQKSPASLPAPPPSVVVSSSARADSYGSAPCHLLQQGSVVPRRLRMKSPASLPAPQPPPVAVVASATGMVPCKIMKRPAVQGARKVAMGRHTLCPGRHDELCIFSTDIIGGAAQRHEATCQWCRADDALSAACNVKASRNHLARSLKIFRENDADIIFDTAVERLPAEWRRLLSYAFLQIPAVFKDDDTLAAACAKGHGRDKISRFLRKVRLQHAEHLAAIEAFLPEDFQEGLAQRAREDLTASWTEVLAHRKRAAAPMTATEVTKYRKGIAADKKFVQKKFNLQPVDAAASSRAKCGLPLASSEVRTEMFEEWCFRGSWQMCVRCHSLKPRPLRAEDLLKKAKALHGSSQCKNCAAGVYVPQPADIPGCLQGLDVLVVAALRPLEVDPGKHQVAQYGYRIKTGMIGFSWAATDVTQKIVSLDSDVHQRQAKNAFKFLMRSKESRYAYFVGEHRRFLSEMLAFAIVLPIDTLVDFLECERTCKNKQNKLRTFSKIRRPTLTSRAAGRM